MVPRDSKHFSMLYNGLPGGAEVVGGLGRGLPAEGHANHQLPFGLHDDSKYFFFKKNVIKACSSHKTYKESLLERFH